LPQPRLQKNRQSGYRPGEKLQELVKSIELSLLGDETTIVESPALLVSKSSGGLREHDVLITQTLPHRRVLTAIECKDHSRPIDYDVIDAFKTKCEDTLIDKKVIVSSKGFRANAIKTAKDHGIALMTLQEAKRRDWKYEYDITGINRRPTSGAIMLCPETVVVQPLRLWERGNDGSEHELPDGGSAWMLYHFNELMKRGLLPTTRTPGKDTYTVRVELEPIDHLFVVDGAGERHGLRSVDLIYEFEETRSSLPMEFHSYGAVESDDRFYMTTATLPFPGSPTDVNVTIVDSPDGSYKLTQTERPKQ
jgi:Restriction endonuclease